MQARWQDEPGGKSSLRVSRIVRRNLEAEAAGAATEYGAASAGAGAADVKLHTPDAEVDFDERASDAGEEIEGAGGQKDVWHHEFEGSLRNKCICWHAVEAVAFSGSLMV